MRLLTFSFHKNSRFKSICLKWKKSCSTAEPYRLNVVNQNTGDPSLVEVDPSWKPEEEPELRITALRGMRVLPEFVSEHEEANLLAEVEPRLKRMRYEFDHWDNAIEGYRETERAEWSKQTAEVWARLRAAAFPNGTPLPRVHVLDLAPAGYIRPHVDAVRFCGDIIAGICLLSPAVMVLRHADAARQHLAMRALLPRRALYIISGRARYDFAHSVPAAADAEGAWRGQPVRRTRRISLICRSPPDAMRRDGSEAADMC